MSATCHYISDFKPQSDLLDCFEIKGNHTAANLAKELGSIATKWAISDKTVACVSDSAANIKRAVNDILHWNHLGCFEHKLNLTVRYGIQQPSIQELIQKVKAIAEYMRRSTAASAKLREVQLQMGHEQLRLKQDVATRWNSTYYMLKRVTELKEPLVSTLALVNPQLPALPLGEWETVKEACNILQPFEEVTVELSNEMHIFVIQYMLLMIQYIIIVIIIINF